MQPEDHRHSVLGRRRALTPNRSHGPPTALKIPLECVSSPSPLTVVGSGRLTSVSIIRFAFGRRLAFQSHLVAQFLQPSEQAAGESIRIQLIEVIRAEFPVRRLLLQYLKDHHQQRVGQPLRVRCRRPDESRFLLVNRGFHWVNERPFIR